MPRPRYTNPAATRARELRNQMPVSEATVWNVVRRGQCGARFRRQVPIGRWIVDFATFLPRLVLEIDDPSHEFRDERDEEERTAYIEGRGFPILRLTNRYVAKEVVVGTISYWVAELKAGRRPE